MRLFKLLSFRIFIFVFLIFSSLILFVSLLQLQSTADQYEKMMTACGLRTSELISGSIRRAMLLNQKEEVNPIIQILINRPDLEKIRIFNKKGKIVFSADDTELNQKVNLESEACYSCHPNTREIITKPTSEERKRLFLDNNGNRLLGFVTPINNAEGCSVSGCHADSSQVKILGTLDVVLSLKQTDANIAQQRNEIISTSISVTLFLSLLIGALVWLFVHIPVRNLTKGTQEISRGNLNFRIKSTTKDEIGQLASSFNTMADDLNNAKDEITTWSNELENRVKEKSEELKNTQKHILQMEKMASLGKLSASVAHELNNPIAGILTYIKLIQKKLSKQDLQHNNSEIIKLLKIIENESERSGSIVKNLLIFSRKYKTRIRAYNINDIIEKSLLLVQHHLQLNEISLEKSLQPELPELFVDENQIKQALIALFINAVEAMEKNGVLAVTTKYSEKDPFVQILIQDNGHGITKDDIIHIFEPFYTTKNEVKGVGLGLSIVYGIIESHRGKISVESNPGNGTIFTIQLPVNKQKESG